MKFRILFTLGIFLLVAPKVAFAKNIGWISDIHAGGTKLRNSQDVSGNVQEPRNYAESLNSVLNELKNSSVDTVIASGDNVNSGERKYAQIMRELAKKYKINVLWVKGNHDSNDSMRALGFPDEKYDYFVDYENIRIIILDNTSIYEDFYGGLKPEQIEWLKQALNTDRDVVISMHVPIFSKENVLLDRYREFENIVSTKGNVKLVLFGHFHVNYQTELNGVKYKILLPLTMKNANGTYGLIDLQNFQTQYLMAKKIKYSGSDGKKKIIPRSVRTSKSKLKKGDFSTNSGKNFTKKSIVNLYFSKLDGSYYPSISVKTNKKGEFYYRYYVKLNQLSGKYNWYAVDMKTGKKSKKVNYTVN